MTESLGALWLVALSVMGLAIIAALSDGYGIKEAVTFGLYCGPGWLALLTVVALILRALGLGK